MSFWGLQTFKISQIMMLMQTDRNLFLNEHPVCILPGIYVEIGEKWLMEISFEEFLGSNLVQRPTCPTPNMYRSA